MEAVNLLQAPIQQEVAVGVDAMEIDETAKEGSAAAKPAPKPIASAVIALVSAPESMSESATTETVRSATAFAMLKSVFDWMFA